jgi:NAD(P)-dependent dehydrogenase (short-subunit alcohol dehydrogenase family)
MRNGKNRPLFLIAGATGAALAMRAMVRSRRYMDPAGKVVLVTGGSRGLGLVLARQLAGQGAKLAICARDVAELNRAKQDLGCDIGQLLTVQCDVRSQPQVNGMIEGVVRHFGGVDILINNAGVISVGPMETMTVQDYVEAMNTHFYGPLFTTLAAIPLMKRRGGGRIVNVSSIGGLVPAPHLLPYVASKFALAGFSQGLRAELLKDNIYVTSVFPGLMRTGSPRNAFFKGQNQAEYAWFKIADSLPLVSMSAERAAQQIINAFTHGRAHVVLTVQAKLAALIHDLLPGVFDDIGAMFNYLLPRPGGIGRRRVQGAASETDISASRLTGLTESAAEEYNQVT